MRGYSTEKELYKNGTALVFHRSRAGVRAWTHKPGEECKVCDKEKKSETPQVPGKH